MTTTTTTTPTKFVRSFVRSFVVSLFRSFDRSFVRSFGRSVVRAFNVRSMCVQCAFVVVVALSLSLFRRCLSVSLCALLLSVISYSVDV